MPSTITKNKCEAAKRDGLAKSLSFNKLAGNSTKMKLDGKNSYAWALNFPPICILSS
jgi:hypothetical protein